MVNIKVLPLGAYQTNCYLAWDEESDDCIVIDPGYAPEQVILEAEDLGKKIDAILLTHGHFDHVGGVRGIVEVTGCPVYLHEKELSQPEEMTAGPLYYTCSYGEGDVLQLAGLTIRVLHTPGHTQGSVCLMVEDTLFSGDTLFMDSIGRTDFPGGSITKMRASLKRLSQLEGNYQVLSGHGPATTLSQEKQYNPYMQ